MCFSVSVLAESVLESGMDTYREGVNREKLSVKKIIKNEMFFFHRLYPL